MNLLSISGKLVAQQLVDDLRVGLTAGLSHHVSDEAANLPRRAQSARETFLNTGPAERISLELSRSNGNERRRSAQ